MRKKLLIVLIGLVTVIFACVFLWHLHTRQADTQNEETIRLLTSQLDALSEGAGFDTIGDRQTKKSYGLFECLGPCIGSNAVERNVQPDNSEITVQQAFEQINQSAASNGFGELSPGLEELASTNNGTQYFYAQTQDRKLSLRLSADYKNGATDNAVIGGQQPTVQEFLDATVGIVLLTLEESQPIDQ